MMAVNQLAPAYRARIANLAKARIVAAAMRRGKPMPGKPWAVPGFDTELTLRWHAGETAGAIAAVIAQAWPGVTRSAVLGRAHRLKLPCRPSPIKRAA